MQEFDDQELLRRWSDQDQEAFAVLVAPHHGMVAAACRRAAPGGEADDCTQAVFLVLARRPQAAERSPTVAMWLLRTSYHICCRAHRSAERRRRAEHQAPVPTPPPAGNEALVHLDECLSRLPERQREAVSLHYLAGLTPEAVAEQLGTNRNHIYQLLRRGLMGLRTHLAGRGVALSAAGLASVLAAEAQAASAPATGSMVVTLTAGNATPAAMALSRETLAAMTVAKVSIVAASVLGLAVTGLAVTLALAPAAPVRKDPTSSGIQVVGLRTEGAQTPVGLEVAQPRLTWELATAATSRGVMQSAAQVRVATSAEALTSGQADLWDSGKVETPVPALTYRGPERDSQQASWWAVRVWDRTGLASTWSSPSRWTTGLVRAEDWTAQWIRPQTQDDQACPWFRKDFEIPWAAERAQVTVSVLGYAEVYLDGQRLGTDPLAPEISNLGQRALSLTYDLGQRLSAGRHVLGVWTGPGWALRPVRPALRPALRVQLEAQASGQRFRLGTDSSWATSPSTTRHLGAWQRTDYGGELVDARLDQPGWNQVGFDARSWSHAVEANEVRVPIIAQSGPGNRLGPVVPAMAVLAGATPAQPSLIDFGTTMTGFVRLEMPQLPTGTRIRLGFFDHRRKVGDRMVVSQRSEFIAGGGRGEVFTSRFQAAGFRYLEVEGLPEPPAISQAQAFPITAALEDAGEFSCSNPLLNRIHQVNRWTLGCLSAGGYLMNNPHRERLGDGGGAQASLDGFLANYRAETFLRKWLGDWRREQAPDGHLANVAPYGGRGRGTEDGSTWSGFPAAATWKHWLAYGDRRVVDENTEGIQRYLAWLDGRTIGGILRSPAWDGDPTGDRLAPGMDEHTEDPRADLFRNCYRILLWETLADLRTAQGRHDEAAACRARAAALRPLVHRTYYDPVRRDYGSDSQACLVMPLLAGVPPAEERPGLVAALEQAITVNRQDHLDTGVLGTAFLFELLNRLGRDDLAFRIMNQRTYPGWGHMIDAGATTFWEHWDGRWSHLQSSFTSADNWLFRGPGGIRPDPEGPGYRYFRIEPAIVGDLTWVRCRQHSPYGTIRSDWRITGNRLELEVEVPPSSTARVRLPARTPAGVLESGVPLADAAGVRVLPAEPNAAIFELTSGHYLLTADRE